MSEPAVEELLELLGLSPGPPEPRLFEDLFLRFQARIPYETLSRAETAGLSTGELLERIVAEPIGCAGQARTRVFAHVARALGYELSLAEGRARRAAGPADAPHAALVAHLGARELLADVGFPLNLLVPLESPRELASPFGALVAERRDGAISVTIEGHGHADERIRLDAPAPLGRGGENGGEDEEGHANEEPFLLRMADDRVLVWSAGRMRVEDAWSRLSYSLPAHEEKALRALLAIEPELVARAGGHTERAGAATLDVYDRCPLPASEVLGRLSSPEEAARALAPGVRVAALERQGSGWRWTLDDGGVARRETVVRQADGLEIVDESGEARVGRRRLRVEPLASGCRLSLEATLSGEVPPLGPGEPFRKTLVFHLVSELLALGS